MIEKVIKALTKQDAKALAECFSENCTYLDYCPSINGKPNGFVYGSACIEMFFKKMFISEGHEVAEPVIESDTRATFFGVYSGPYIYARFNIEELDNDGLIKKAVVHPA
ncbi:MAG: hypothetical protein GX823_02995 [Clostridiales bacterium]|nr:hypothetical protein [Clostridiales bacterium]